MTFLSVTYYLEKWTIYSKSLEANFKEIEKAISESIHLCKTRLWEEKELTAWSNTLTRIEDKLNRISSDLNKYRKKFRKESSDELPDRECVLNKIDVYLTELVSHQVG